MYRLVSFWDSRGPLTKQTVETLRASNGGLPAQGGPRAPAVLLTSRTSVPFRLGASPLDAPELLARGAGRWQCSRQVFVSAPKPLLSALSQMGYNLSPQFTCALVSRYCPRLRQSRHAAGSLHSGPAPAPQVLTEAFREKDTAVQGSIRLASRTSSP